MDLHSNQKLIPNQPDQPQLQPDDPSTPAPPCLPNLTPPKGLIEDPTILFVGDVELVELKAIDEEPLVVVQFNCQQIKCTRDKFGNVISGSPNSIQKVFYFWGLQQEAAGMVLPDGRVLAPRWVIKDMMWQSMLALV